MNLRPYQQKLFDDCRKLHASGTRNVLAVLPTGGGKTVVFSEYIRAHGGPTCAIAHRQELVTQMSLALARDGVKHRIVGPASVVKLAVRQHMEEVGRSHYDPQARVAVAGVDTLIRRREQLERWRQSVTLWVIDEAHHLCLGNKWGEAVEMFPNAIGLGVTATPCRADGKGLGRHADGVFDAMVEGPSMRRLIDQKYLTEYRIFAPPNDLDLSDVNVGGTGDYTMPGLKKAVRRSKVVGDVVSHYLRIAKGKLGVTFATDVETARDIASQFEAAGVPAAALDAKTPAAERITTIRKFRRRELLQLVNVDLFGEGFDLPAIEVVSMARPTQSYGLYSQQFGRALRILEGKTEALVIDHVGNVLRHGLPDRVREWTLDRREGRGKSAASDAVPTTACPECCGVYERIHAACPYCGHAPEPASRSGPEFVDGDLSELDPATLAAMRGEVVRVDKTDDEYAAELAGRYIPDIGRPRMLRRHRDRRDGQSLLRLMVSWWAGAQREQGRPDSESYRLFYHAFGMDVLTAQTLGGDEARSLAEKIEKKLLMAGSIAAR